jgi:hypothetical protein
MTKFRDVSVHRLCILTQIFNSSLPEYSEKWYAKWPRNEVFNTYFEKLIKKERQGIILYNMLYYFAPCFHFQ